MFIDGFTEQYAKRAVGQFIDLVTYLKELTFPGLKELRTHSYTGFTVHLCKCHLLELKLFLLDLMT